MSTMPSPPDDTQPGDARPGDELRCTDLVAAFDWGRTALGSRAHWEPSIRATVDLLLAAPLPMAFSAGEGYVQIYNDAWAELLGPRHPATLGRPSEEPGLAIAEVFRTGRAVLEPEAQLTVLRGEPGQAFFTRGHTPVRDRRGAVAGVLTVAAETTQVTRGLQSLGELTSRLAGALTIDDVARVVLGYATASFDVDHCVFAVDDGSSYRYVRRVRGEMLDEADERLPPVWKRISAQTTAPLVTAALTGRPSFIADGEPLLEIASDRH
jgi:hypothetical protein